MRRSCCSILTLCFALAACNQQSPAGTAADSSGGGSSGDQELASLSAPLTAGREVATQKWVWTDDEQTTGAWSEPTWRWDRPC